MEDVNNRICRLCLGVVSAGGGEAINETIKEQLGVLLIRIDFDVTANAVACNGCIEKLQECFDFKSKRSYTDDCFASRMNVDVKVDIKTAFEKEMIEENANVENVQMCRLCMSPLKDESFNCATDLKDEFYIGDMLRNCLLEVDFNAVPAPLICKQCLSSAKKYSELIKTCHEVEERIKNYRQVAEGYNITDRVILTDVLEFKNCDVSTPTLIKMECSNVDISAMEHCEDSVRVKWEEVDVKDELDIKIKVSESIQSGHSNCSGKNDSSKRKRPAPKERQISTSLQKCCLCPFVADTRSLLKAHMRHHEGTIKAFSCPECPYKTNLKCNLKRHFLTHKDKSEVEMQKCPLCPYSSKYKSALSEHRQLKHDPNIKLLKCKHCSYSSKHKRNFVSHQLLHKNPGEIPMYKCANCDYETKFKSSLMHHMKIHSDEHSYKFRFNNLTRVFECRRCTYKTDSKPQLAQHCVTHEWKAQVHMCPLCPFKSKYKYAVVGHWKLEHDVNPKMYECQDCAYTTKQRKNFMRHLLVHKNPDSGQFKCEQCPYRAKRQDYIKRHMLTHSSENLHSCDQCTYRTPFRTSLRDHMSVHRIDIIQCDQCDFQTKHKGSLRRHRRLHDPTRPTFNCDQCEYCATNKDKLRKHQVKHKQVGDIAMYRCLTCDYKTKYKHSLPSHMVRAQVCLRTKKEVVTMN